MSNIRMKLTRGLGDVAYLKFWTPLKTEKSAILSQRGLYLKFWILKTENEILDPPKN